MENRWLVLLTAVAMTATSFTLSWELTEIIDAVAAKWVALVSSWLSKLGFSLQIGVVEISFITRALAMVWIYPFVLRLGLLRFAAWTALAVAGAILCFEALSNSAGSRMYFLCFGFPALLPGVAMIGRRTRPWLILPASAAFTAVFHLGSQIHEGDFLWAAQISLPYAAILIFGTKLIPKSPATEAPPD
jgi:hypothetical protein